MKTDKFRPCLTSKQITHILSLCKKDLSEESFLLIGVLAPFKAKIENNSISPSYSVDENTSVFNSLGYDDDDQNYSNLSYAEKIKQAFDKWSNNPDLCNAKELNWVHEHKMLNDLYSPEEWEKINAEHIAKYGYPLR